MKKEDSLAYMLDNILSTKTSQEHSQDFALDFCPDESFDIEGLDQPKVKRQVQRIEEQPEGMPRYYPFQEARLESNLKDRELTDCHTRVLDIPSKESNLDNPPRFRKEKPPYLQIYFGMYGAEIFYKRDFHISLPYKSQEIKLALIGGKSPEGKTIFPDRELQRVMESKIRMMIMQYIRNR